MADADIRKLSGGLPELYARWVDELLDGAPVPDETEATCDDCAMCAPPDGQPGPAAHFDPRVKCCTYLPALPNFLVGRILDGGGPGARSVQERLERREGATPLGLMHPRSFQVRYESSRPAFGRAPSLRCPHYEGERGRCLIWRHRDAVCSTWFCKHVRGDVGFRFWIEAVKPLLLAIERAVARECLSRLELEEAQLAPLLAGPSSDPIRLTSDEVEHRVEDASWRAAWGRWVGRESELYRACGQIAAGLGWPEIEAIGGVELRLRARLVRSAHRRLVDEPPLPALQPGAFQLVQLGTRAARLVGYSPYDPLDVPPILLEALGRFDGRPTAEVLEGLAEAGLALDEALVRRLADFGILVPVDAAPPASP